MPGTPSEPPRSQPPPSSRASVRARSEPPLSEPPRSERARRAAAIVKLTLSGALVPAGCACCGEPAPRTLAARAPGGGELLVGYCEECLAHVGRGATRALAGGVASGLVGFGLGLALPFSAAPLGPFALVAVVLAASLVPLFIVRFVPRTPELGHSAAGRAARFVAAGELLCANDRFAKELARANGGTLRHVAWSERRGPLRLFVVPVLAAAAALALYFGTTPVVRLLNLGPDRVFVELDGRRLATIDPTSVEAPTAGVEVRVGAGTHELVARTAEREVERARVRFESGHAHLFAPGSDGYCFWLETAEYGRARAGTVTRDPLAGPPHFWVLPKDLGGWFRPLPEQALAEARLTGGVVTVLRQAPCGPDP